MQPSRRAALGSLCALVLGCGRRLPVAKEGDDSAGPALDCVPPDIDPADPAWVELPLADHPTLREVGGVATVSLPSALLELVVGQPTAGCWFAVWRICTHGSCVVDWEAEARELVCPCHHSRFGEDGAVHRGPATLPLRAFPVGRQGDSLWIYRPL